MISGDGYTVHHQDGKPVAVQLGWLYASRRQQQRGELLMPGQLLQRGMVAFCFLAFWRLNVHLP